MATLKLTQTKVFVGPGRFGVRHVVSDANPPFLGSPFIADLSGSPYDKERFVRVATINEIVGNRYPVKRLDHFGDVSVDFAGTGVIAGDKLTAQIWPAEWGRVAPEFTVKTCDGPLLVLEEQFLWSAARPLDGVEGVTWTLKRGEVVVSSGTEGYTVRDGGDGACFVDQFMTVHQTGDEALNHMVTVKTYVEALAKNPAFDGSSFEQYPPGNPVISEYK